LPFVQVMDSPLDAITGWTLEVKSGAEKCNIVQCGLIHFGENSNSIRSRTNHLDYLLKADLLSCFSVCP
jgi:hypothetical protein